MSCPADPAVDPDPAVHVSPRTGGRWRSVIGLEVHCQLATLTKIFCGCPTTFGAPPNTQTCAVCTGQPGALPVLNAEAVELAVLAAVALEGQVAAHSAFDRKNYFYCDLPKGYQITQYAEPYCTGGSLELSSGKRVRLARIHLEEDAGKAIHDRGARTLVDLNRAGVPLIEAVSEPDLASAGEAHEFLTRLEEILRWIGASDGDMEKGSLRCDVNVSVHPEGEPWRARVEVKNLNSFRHVKDAIEHEIARQIEAWESGERTAEPVQETRLWDAERGITRTLRTKEDALDYRYFPEPDLRPLEIGELALLEQRRRLPELPAARRARYERELGLSPYDAGVLCSEREVADFFEITARLSGDAANAAKWVANDVLGALADPEIGAASLGEWTLRPHDVAQLMGLVLAGRVTRSAAKEVLRHMIAENLGAGAALRALDLETVRDDAQIEAWCREVLASRAEVADQVRAGNEKALGALIGPVMAKSAGRADAQRVRAALARLIRAES